MLDMFKTILSEEICNHIKLAFIFHSKYVQAFFFFFNIMNIKNRRILNFIRTGYSELVIDYKYKSLSSSYVTVYRKIGHNAAPTKNFFCTYRLLGKQILSSPSFIAVALAIPAIYCLTVPFVRLI